MLFGKSHLERRAASCLCGGALGTYITARGRRKTGIGRRRGWREAEAGEKLWFQPGGDADEQDPKTRCRCSNKSKTNSTTDVFLTGLCHKMIVIPFCIDTTEWETLCFESTAIHGLQDHPWIYQRWLLWRSCHVTIDRQFVGQETEAESSHCRLSRMLVKEVPSFLLKCRYTLKLCVRTCH